jgi:hypothetical protein
MFPVVLSLAARSPGYQTKVQGLFGLVYTQVNALASF